MQVTMFISGAKVAEFNLLRYAGRVIDLSQPLDAIGSRTKIMLRRNFDTQGAYRSGGWTALSKREVDYKAWLRAHGRKADPRILRLSGALYRGLTQRSGQNVIYSVRPGELRLGVRLPYARRLNKGGGGIPARPFLNLTTEDQRDFGRLVLRYIVTGRS